MAEEKKVTRKKIAATTEMNKIMSDYFYSLNDAVKNNRKIAWCTSVGPAELLLSMGFKVYFPENHGALLGSSRLAAEVIPQAVIAGFSPDICSYLTSDIGAFVKGVTPLSKAFPGIEKVPKPDVLVFNTNQCRDVQDWFNWYGRHFKVPVLGVRTHRGVGEVTDTIVTSIAKQFEDLVQPLEKISGAKFDIDKFRTIIALSRECSELWKECLNTSSAIPSPWTFFDGTIHMGPAVVLRGTPQAVDYYKLLKAELEDRAKNKVAAVEGEKFRIYWEGMPVWGRLRDHSELFAGLQACVLASTYCNSWVFTDLNPADPFRSMAKAYTELFIARSDEIKERYLKKMFDLFKVHGVIYLDAKTCPNNSNNRYGLPQRMEQITGIPSLTINGDLNDMRLVSDEQTRTNIEAFIEQLAEKKR
jgi:benzoyl-CoA reductase/2-hydroxyglutaryl-CoA dehydratase subunit BcrC/BadD/HgdB